MFKINNETFTLKTKDATIKIEENNKILNINFLTYIVVFNERMDDINIKVNFNINENSIKELNNKEYKFNYEVLTPTWNDHGVGTIKFIDIVGNIAKVNLVFNNLYNYEIETNMEFTWLILDNNDYTLEDINNYIDISDIEEIPFITEENNTKETRYMFVKQKEEITWM